MTTMKDANAIQYKTVLILTKGASQKPDVKRRCEELKYKGNEQIEWVITPPDVPFTVKFKEETGSPFEGKKFNNTNNISGPPIYDPGEKDRYYAYTLDVQGHIIDPGVIIWN